MIVFFSIYFLVAVAFGTYIAWSLLGNTRVQRTGKVLCAASVVGIMFLMPITILLRKAGHESALIESVVWFGYLAMGFLSFLFCLAIMRDATRLITGLQRSLKRHIQKIRRLEPAGPLPVDPSCRRFIGYGVTAGITTAATVLTGVGVAEARSIPNVKRVEVPFDNLPEDLHGFRIVQITDIHVSPTIHRPFVEGVVDTVNRLQPDIVAHTGDLVDGSVKRLAYHVEPLRRLQATYGTFFVTGNHEYYSGADQWIRKVRDLGHEVLLNENRLIRHGTGRLLVAGVTDYRAGNFNPPRPPAQSVPCKAPSPLTLSFFWHISRKVCSRPRKPVSIFRYPVIPWRSVLALAAGSQSGTTVCGGTASISRYPDLRQPGHRLLGAAHPVWCTIRDHAFATRPRLSLSLCCAILL